VRPEARVRELQRRAGRERLRLAVVGTGVSGLVAARLLHPNHDVTVLEAAPRLGGHVHTHDVELDGRSVAVDSGFIVFNRTTYPRFTRLLELLGVASRPTSMSFSVRCERTGLEYAGSSLDALFAQRRNLVSPRFWGMLGGILRFHREAPRLLERPDETLTLGEYLERGRYGRAFVDAYVVPMGAAIWSAEPRRMLDFPAVTFVRFFTNHGMLSIRGRPVWRTVTGGSRRYVDALVAPLADRVRTDAPVTSLRRTPGSVVLRVADGPAETFDGVVVATHSDRALRLLDDPTPAERAVLGAIPYQENEAVLHTDARQLPARRRAWAAWNYHVPREPRARLAVTYDMNVLQGLDAVQRACVTLNPAGPIDPARVLARMTYHHPVFTPAGIAAQRRRAELDEPRTWFCGAYWGYGFHEDGVRSALDVTRDFGAGDIEDAALAGSRRPVFATRPAVPGTAS